MLANTVLLVTLLTIGVYQILSASVAFPSGKSIRMINRARRLRHKPLTLTEAFYKYVVDPIADWALPLVRMDEYKKKTLAKQLRKIGLELSPEKYVARCAVFSVLVALSSSLFWTLNMPLVAGGVTLLALLIYFKNLQEPAEKEKKVNREILRELPKLVSTFEHSLATSNDVTNLFEKYRIVAGPAFAYDLDVLIADLRLGNQEQALRAFDDRLNIPQVTDFVSALIGILHGTEQREYLKFIASEMRTLSRENIRREIERRPERIRPFIVLIVIGAMALFMTPILLSIMRNMNAFG